MNEAIKELWVNALESGEYQQGRGFLKRNENYCCLGVLCDLYLIDTGLGEWKDVPIEVGDLAGEIVFSSENENSSCSPPVAVIRWAGIRDSEFIENLVGMNDIQRKNFIEIAAHLKETS